MVNSNRGTGGRFTARPINNHVNTHPLPQAAPDNAEHTQKKRRLNDGSPQPTTKPVEEQDLKAASAAAPSSALPSQSQPERHPTPVTPKERRTQPAKSPTKTEEKRTLRSKDVARPRSELVNFFADFETVVFGPPKPDDDLTQQIPLLITNKIPRSSSLQKLSNELPVPPSATLAQHPTAGQAQPLANNAISREGLPLKSPKRPTGPIFRKIRLPRQKTASHRTDHDPLSDELYDAAHRRGERKEKQSRNWDKERAMHEKGELERLLRELRGPDWLKLMGITGVSDVEAKKFKAKRDIFIRRAQSMLDRYAAWNKRDRELKLERERRLAEEDEETSDNDDDSEDTEESRATPSPNGRSAKRPRKDAQTRTQEKPSVPSIEPKPFTSFFEKPHMREAAMKSYRRGRNVLAFGLPIPDMPEVADFQLPASITNARPEVAHL